MRNHSIFSAGILLATLAAFPQPTNAQTAATPQIEEISIADLEAALTDKRLTCRQVVEHYIRRIDTYDKNGP
ncbi:MAG: amidase family protein, partial [Gemmatimonadaceae bacterium]